MDSDIAPCIWACDSIDRTRIFRADHTFELRYWFPVKTSSSLHGYRVQAQVHRITKVFWVQRVR
jgi:hypothetical protein